MSNSLTPIKAGGLARSIVPLDFDQLQRMANVFVLSKTFKPSPGASQEQALAECCIVIQRGLDVGFTPSQAVEGIALINGKTNIYGDSLTSLLLAGGCKVQKWHEGEGDSLVGHAEIIRPDGQIIKKTYSIADAKKAGLTRSPVWQKFPARMVEWRAFGFAVKDGASDFSKGLSVFEEEAPQFNGEPMAIESDPMQIENQTALPPREGGPLNLKGEPYQRPSVNAYKETGGGQRFNALVAAIGETDDRADLQKGFDAHERNGMPWAQFPAGWAKMLHENYCHRLKEIEVIDAPDLDEELADQEGLIAAIEESIAAADSAEIRQEIIDSNADLVARCSPQNRLRIAEIYAEAAA